ncbi:hypothetical protein QBC38DRAFT_253641 [Podospora fimiseda]|uniref:Rhodopsin domain-containing protein n=1 Tax=Podospora fimiseda TaxID=252190 RepID=A0AAN7H1E5_9PEZI|nr:hypothetical protein QBC38DRAFT_253641 [Podospora fimiseda]
MSESSDHVPNRGHALFAVNTVGVILAGISCILRCYVRSRILKSFGTDDWLILASTLTFITYVSFSNTGVKYGTGRHREDLHIDANRRAMRGWYFCYIFYALTMILVKLSIGNFLLRVTVSRVHQWIIYLASIVTCISCITFLGVAIFQCHPVNYFWDRYHPGVEGACLNGKVLLGLSYLYSVFSIISDFTFALLPAWVVGHLNMARNTKIALIALMGMGCVASAGVAARMPYLQYMSSDDFLWDTTYMALWSSVEMSLAITAGCLATVQPLVKLIGEKMGIISIHKSTQGTGGLPSSSQAIGGEISVKKTFSRRTEMYDMATKLDSAPREGELKLQPKPSGYSAMCYNTSQEELRPGHSLRDMESKEDMTVAAVKAKEIP